MPEEGVKLSKTDKLLTTDEIRRLASLFVKNLNVKKIRLTGGEPLIRKDIVQIVNHLDELRSNGLQLITLTTNATTLQRNCSALRNAGKSLLRSYLKFKLGNKLRYYYHDCCASFTIDKKSSFFC